MALISTYGLSLVSTSNLQTQQNTLALLNQQLASSKKYSDLTLYKPSEARQLMNLQNAITQREAYIGAIQTVETRLDIYDLTLTDLEKIAAQAAQLASQNQTYDPTKTGPIATQLESYIQQVITDLNQKVGDRYIYAGSRYSTQPVVDLTSLLALTAPTLPFTPTADPNLPEYDSGYAGDPTQTEAFFRDSVTIDAGNSVQYGVTSVADGIQQLIAGLQLMYAASQTTDPSVYQTNMTGANNLLRTALTNIQTLHSGVANATNTLAQEKDFQKQAIDTLKTQIGDIQNVDLTEIGTTLNLLQTQLQASYSATANLTQLSILRYL